MHTIQTSIEEALTAALQKIDIASIPIEVDADPVQGDYSSNAALIAFGKVPKGTFASPRAAAQKIVDNLGPSDNYTVSIAGPGFINFFLETEKVHTAFALPQFPGNDKKAIIEYMQPNTNKPLHVGHLRNAILGKGLIEILRTTGWKVIAATINNDRGLHITKSMWAYLIKGQKQETQGLWQEKISLWSSTPSAWTQPEDLKSDHARKGDYFVGHWYVVADAYADDATVGKEWQEMLLAWENNDDPLHTSVRALWKQMNDWFYQGMEESYKKLGVTFDPDHISYESDIYAAGRQIILDHVEDGTFEKLPDAAIQANLEEKFGIPDKILLRRDGTGIYMTFDVELTRQRVEQHADLLVWVVGNDQDLYFKQLFAVAQQLGYGNPELFHHFSYGMVRLPEGKMSSRKGTVIYADDVVEHAIERARLVMEQAGVGKNLDSEKKESIAQQVGIGAVKYTMLSYDPQSQIAFDVDQSVTFDGDSGPYIQYTHARACSVLEKVIQEKSSPPTTDIHPLEKAVIHKLEKYRGVLLRSAMNYAPHYICRYLIELSQEFNHFYAECNPILGNTLREEITQHTKATITHGLTLLGISSPEKM